MTSDFYQHLFNKHQTANSAVANQTVIAWAKKIIHFLYPEQTHTRFNDIAELSTAFNQSKQELITIIKCFDPVSSDKEYNAEAIAASFYDYIPEIFRVLNTDIQAIYHGDPASVSELEIVRTYPGFLALCFYRLGHFFFQNQIPLLPRILTEYAHSKTGIDIHPGASIGEYFQIDHGTGIVIGESCKIGNHVKMYQGVTLGAISVSKDLACTKRHPTVENHVVIYAGATILGGDTIIGHNSIIGGNVWLTHSVPPYSVLYHNPSIKYKTEMHAAYTSKAM